MLASAAKRQEKSDSNKSLFKWWAHLDSSQGLGAKLALQVEDPPIKGTNWRHRLQFVLFASISKIYIYPRHRHFKKKGGPPQDHRLSKLV